MCVFNLSAISQAFNGPFKYQENSRSAWLPYPNPNPNFQVIPGGRGALRHHPSPLPPKMQAARGVGLGPFQPRRLPGQPWPPGTPVDGPTLGWAHVNRHRPFVI